MRRHLLLCAFVSLCFSIVSVASVAARGAEDGIPIAEVERDAPVDFETEILPVLRNKCLACHNTSEPSSDLVLETPEAMIKGGFIGPAIEPGNSEESYLLQLASHQDEPIMPPEDNEADAEPLTSEELGLIKLWIDQGAKGEVTGAEDVDWQPLPPGVNPIYAVAVSPDGQFVAAGRANQIFIYHLPTQREVGRLTDPALLETGVYDRPGVAHLDLVQSLRFSPDSTLLASGGYRTVKLWSRPRSVRKMSLVDLPSMPTSVAVSGDGRVVAVGQENGEIMLLAGGVVQTLVGHKDAVSGLDFIGEASQLVSGSQDQTLRIWNIQDGSSSVTIEAPAAVNDVALVNQDSQVAAAGSDNIIRLWSLADPAEEPVQQFEGHKEAVTALCSIGADGARLLSGSEDGTARVWDVDSGKSVRSLDHGGPVADVAARPDGSRFASAGTDSMAKLWDAEGKELAELKGDFRQQLQVEEVERALAVAKRQIDNTQADLKQVTERKAAEEENAQEAVKSRKEAEEEFETKEQLAAEAEAEKEAAEKKLAQAKTAAEEAEKAKETAEAKTAEATKAISKADSDLEEAEKASADAKATKADAEQERKKAAAAKEKSEEQKEEAERAKKKAKKQSEVAQKKVEEAEAEVKKATEPAEEAIAERDAAKKTLESAVRSEKRAQEAVEKVAERIPQVEATVEQAEQKQKETETLLATVKEQAEQKVKPYRTVGFSRDGQTVALGGDARSVFTWDADTGAAVETYTGHEAEIHDLAYSPNGDVLSIAADQSLFVWNTRPGWSLHRVIGSVDDPQTLVDRVTALDFSPDGKLLATGGGEPSRSGELKFFNVEDGSLVREIEDPHSDTIFGLDFSPDGTQIASCGADRFAKIFDVESGEFVRSFEGHTHHVLGVAWRADGRQLATSGADQVIKVWDVRTGDQRRTISGFGKEVTALDFIGTGDNVIAVSGDTSVRLKNTGNGRNVRAYSGPDGFMYTVMSSANGKLIVAGGEDSVVRVWSEDGEAVANFEAPEPQESEEDSARTAERTGDE